MRASILGKNLVIPTPSFLWAPGRFYIGLSEFRNKKLPKQRVGLVRKNSGMPYHIVLCRSDKACGTNMLIKLSYFEKRTGVSYKEALEPRAIKLKHWRSKDHVDLEQG